MISINLLEPHDVIEATDYVRQLDLFYEGQSDTVHTTSMYSGLPVNRLKWQLASEVCPAWIGKKVKKFNRIAGKFCKYEFVRGSVPKKHCEISDNTDWLK